MIFSQRLASHLVRSMICIYLGVQMVVSVLFLSVNIFLISFELSATQHTPQPPWLTTFLFAVVAAGSAFLLRFPMGGKGDATFQKLSVAVAGIITLSSSRIIFQIYFSGHAEAWQYPAYGFPFAVNLCIMGMFMSRSVREFLFKGGKP